VNTRIVSGVLAIVAVAAQVSPAVTITVNSTADNLTGGDGQCTLREALANVNAATDTTSGDCPAGTGTGDTITFTFTRRAGIRLSMGELTISRDVQIVGPPGKALYVNAAGKSRVLTIASAATATISDVTLERGAVSGLGGGIVNGGTVSLTNCTLMANRARGGEGGAIGNYGTVTLTNCVFLHNSADVGGAIDSGGGGTLTASNSTFTGNTARVAGAIYNEGGTATATGCTFIGNKALHWGGGGIYNYNTGLTLTNCTFTLNSGSFGGGVVNQGTLNVTNCTFWRNRAIPGYGGDSSGGAIWHDSLNPAWTATMLNTIVAGSGRGGNCGGAIITSAGHNLSSDGSCYGFTSGGTDLVNTDPKLAPLRNYGGPTQTLALCAGAGVPYRSCTGASPAIDAGDDTVTGPSLNLTTDQRGLPRLSGAHVDIGAYEAQQ